MSDLRHLCESPIEHKFYAALLERLHAEFDGILEFYFGQESLREAQIAGSRRPDYEIHIAPQCEYSGVRIDFSILVRTGMDAQEFHELFIAIECDGHEWHERTKEQARRDRARDRMLSRRGLVVQRFTGSEIVADAAGCARQVYELIMEDAVRGFIAQKLSAAAAPEPEVNAWIPTA